MKRLIFIIAVSAVLLSGCASPRSASTVNQWDYKTQMIGKPRPGEDINRYAIDGWEIVSIAVEPKMREEDADHWTLLLRRPRHSGQ